MQETPIEWSENWYHTPGSLEQEMGVRILRAGQNRAKPKYKVGPRFIEQYSIHVVLEGNLKLVLADREVLLGKGDVSCLFPRLTYQYQATPSAKPLRLFWLTFDGPKAPFFVEKIGASPDAPFIRRRFAENGEPVLLQLASRLKDHEDQAQFGLMGAFLHLIGMLLPPIPAKRESAFGWLDEALNYMNLHYSERISVSEIASRVGVHRSHLTRAFVARTGESPALFLHRLRMQKAAQLLCADRFASVSEIALSLNYPNMFSFSRAFTHFYGMAPSKYRQQEIFPNL
jgi:AraC-like DNA-binding protein